MLLCKAMGLNAPLDPPVGENGINCIVDRLKQCDLSYGLESEGGGSEGTRPSVTNLGGDVPFRFENEWPKFGAFSNF